MRASFAVIAGCGPVYQFSLAAKHHLPKLRQCLVSGPLVGITIVVNSINCVWVAVAGHYMADWLYNIGTTVLTGGISMAIFFFVFKIIFPEGEKKTV